MVVLAVVMVVVEAAAVMGQTAGCAGFMRAM